MSPRTLRSLAVVAATAIVSVTARAQDQSPVRNGRMIVGGTVALTSNHDDATDRTTTSIALQPNVFWFLQDGLAVGGSLRWSVSDSRDASSSSIGVGPAARWYFGDRTGKALPFIGASIIPSHNHSATNVPVGNAPGVTSDGNSMFLDGSLGLTWMLNNHVGLTGEAFYSSTRTTQKNGAISRTNTVTSTGLRFGVSAFLR